MSTETLDTLSIDRQPANTATGWGLPLALTTIGLVALLALYWQTSWSMVEIWWRSETFAHGFMILPISLYLIWLKREELALLQPRASLSGLAALALAAAGWLAGHLVAVQVVEQLALVAMMIAVLWALLGWQVVRTIMFPLGYLFFMVPIGEFLVQPMMEFTAEFSVAMIHLTDIPVYADGFFISLPTGDWSIVEGCSGVRYLIASIAVGTLYAYMFYHSWWRRAAFVLLAIVTPVIANGLRAFMIIMIGHFSGMKLATGVDHLIYGWVFFGLVIMLMFWIGSFWWDKAPAAEAVAGPDRNAASAGNSYWWGVPLLLLLLLAPIALQSFGSVPPGARRDIVPPQGAGGWMAVQQPLSEWRPNYRGATAQRLTSWRRDGMQVDLDVYYYLDQSQGAEMVNSQNILVGQKTGSWQLRGTKQSEISLHGGDLAVAQSVLQRAGLRLLAWEWYWIGGHVTSNDYQAKLMEAWNRVSNPGQGGFALVLSASSEETPDASHRLLQSFVDDMWPQIDASLRSSSAER
jgi:exosortase A